MYTHIHTTSEDVGPPKNLQDGVEVGGLIDTTHMVMLMSKIDPAADGFSLRPIQTELPASTRCWRLLPPRPSCRNLKKRGTVFTVCIVNSHIGHSIKIIKHYIR